MMRNALPNPFMPGQAESERSLGLASLVPAAAPALHGEAGLPSYASEPVWITYPPEFAEYDLDFLQMRIDEARLRLDDLRLERESRR